MRTIRAARNEIFVRLNAALVAVIAVALCGSAAAADQWTLDLEAEYGGPPVDERSARRLDPTEPIVPTEEILVVNAGSAALSQPGTSANALGTQRRRTSAPSS